MVVGAQELAWGSGGGQRTAIGAWERWQSACGRMREEAAVVSARKQARENWNFTPIKTRFRWNAIEVVGLTVMQKGPCMAKDELKNL